MVQCIIKPKSAPLPFPPTHNDIVNQIKRETSVNWKGGRQYTAVKRQAARTVIIETSNAKLGPRRKCDSTYPGSQAG